MSSCVLCRKNSLQAAESAVKQFVSLCSQMLELPFSSAVTLFGLSIDRYQFLLRMLVNISMAAHHGVKILGFKACHPLESCQGLSPLLRHENLSMTSSTSACGNKESKGSADAGIPLQRLVRHGLSMVCHADPPGSGAASLWRTRLQHWGHHLPHPGANCIDDVC